MDPYKYVNDSYTSDKTDEFILPAMNKAYTAEEIALEDNDAVIFANFRPDRARQLSHVIFGSDYYEYKPELRRKNIYFVTMMNYEGISPSCVAYPPVNLKNTLGQVIADHKLSQLRIAETEKYAHVTFFFDGGKEIDFPYEKKILVNSPKVATYDLKPEMSAYEVTDKVIQAINQDKYDSIILNFANSDMVGHTGNLEAAIKAVETLDECVQKIVDIVKKKEGVLLITADHGNDPTHTGTDHTREYVPVLYYSKGIEPKDLGLILGFDSIAERVENWLF